VLEAEFRIEVQVGGGKKLRLVGVSDCFSPTTRECDATSSCHRLLTPASSQPFKTVCLLYGCDPDMRLVI
jgi:hypothetical protein